MAVILRYGEKKMKCKWCGGKVKNNVCQECLIPQDADEKEK